MRIYTRTGDEGETGLFAGGRVPKDHPRIAACGAVDELSAVLGVALAAEPLDFERVLLETAQRDLFTIGATLATPDPAALARALPGPAIGADHIAALERSIDRHEERLTPLRVFILPGGTPKAAALHLARTACRRAERAVVALSHDAPVPPDVGRYLNRLSDLLFVLARAANAQAGTPDIAW